MNERGPGSRLPEKLLEKGLTEKVHRRRSVGESLLEKVRRRRSTREGSSEKVRGRRGMSSEKWAAGKEGQSEKWL